MWKSAVWYHYLNSCKVANILTHYLFCKQHITVGLKRTAISTLPSGPDHVPCASTLLKFSSVQFSCSVASNFLRPHGMQHTRLPCPLQLPELAQTHGPLSQWYHPTISSSVIPFSSCLQSFPASESFPMSQFFTSGGQSIGVFQLQHQSFQWIFRTDFH